MPVNTQHPDYAKMINRWRRCRDVADGQDAVHAAGRAYLPQLVDQTQQDYDAYVKRALFYNATWRTIAGLVGMIFRKPPVVKVPTQAEEYLNDVTMSGTPFEMFAQEVCEEALKVGRLGVLVDYPTADITNLTLADAKTQNLRPTMAIYQTEAVINWKYEKVNNVWALTQVVLEEESYVDIDEFTKKCEKVYRALDLFGGHYRVRLFRMKDTTTQEQIGGDLYPLMNGAPLDFIPFTFLSTDDNSPTVDEPPLIDLVNVNLSHYLSTADLEHGAHFTGLPTPVITGHRPDKEGDKLYIGSQSAWVLPNEKATAKYLEFAGTGLEALEKRLEVKEKQMAILGARMLEQQKRAVESADTQTIHRKGEESMLAQVSQSLSLGLERVLRWFAMWSGATLPDGDTDALSCELNREFYAVAMSDQMLTSLVSAWQQGAISFQTLFDNLQAGDVIDEDKTPEEEQAQIGDTPPKLVGSLTDPATGLPAALPPKDKMKPGKPAPKEPANA
jgi:hypothetical protein